MLSRAFLASLLAAAAGWESGKTCTTDDVRTLAKKDAKLSGTALAECVILDLWPRPPPHLIDLDLRGNIISRGVSVGDHMGELPPPIQWDGPDGQYYQ